MSDGSFVDFRKYSDVSMEEFAALIQRLGTAELQAGVSVATDVTSEVQFQRFEKATRLLLEGTYFSEDIDVCVAAVQELYADNAGNIFLYHLKHFYFYFLYLISPKIIVFFSIISYFFPVKNCRTNCTR